MFAEEVYRQRRRDLAAALTQAGDAGLVLLVGQLDEAYNFSANPYPFRQDSSVLYYLGLTQPRLAALLDIESGDATLVVEAQSDDDRIWCTRETPEALQARCGAQHVLSPAAARHQLQDALNAGRPVHRLPSIRPAQHRWLGELLGQTDVPAPSRHLICAAVRQREVKTAEEIAQIELALGVAAQLHEAARTSCAAGASEAAVVRAMNVEVAQQGARMAYAPICTRDGHVLHHLTHDNVLRRGDLLLIDAGAEVDSGYASDITRTHCVDNAWTDTTRLLHDTVRRAQQAAASAASAGTTMAEVHRVAAHTLVQGLAPLKVFRGSIDAVVDSAAYALLFPHGVGHLLGLDVHDMGSLGEDEVGYDSEHPRDIRFGPNHLRLGKPLRAGMVITLEPGLYAMSSLWQRWQAQGLHADLIDHQALSRLQGFGGIRHEDVFLVGHQGARALGPQILG